MINLHTSLAEIERAIKYFSQRAEYTDHYRGSAQEIALAIVRDRWNGHFFEAGEGLQLSCFWMRDFGFTLLGLIQLGFLAEAKTCLQWILQVFIHQQRVFTTVTSSKVAYDVFTPAADTLPWLMYSLELTGQVDLIERNQQFFNRQLKIYFQEMFDPETLLVKRQIFSIPKDTIPRTQTTVANTFLSWLVRMTEKLPFLQNPFPSSDLITEKLVSTFWTGSYFQNDIMNDGVKIVSSDPNIWPYWTNVIGDKSMLKKSLHFIEEMEMDQPFPLKYHTERYDQMSYPLTKMFLPNYQGNSIWMMNVSHYIELLAKINLKKARSILQEMLSLIEKTGNFYEAWEPDGSTPLKGRFGFGSGKGMLWVANFPKLLDNYK